MTPEQLKTSILYSALKGQLTEQFIGKEDAKRDYPNIKVSTAEDIPYDLPENWLWVDLKEVATNQNGFAFKPSDWLQSGTKIVRIQNLTDADVPCNYCDESIVEDKYKIKDGDVLVSWSCTIDAFLYEGEDAVLNQHIFKIIFDKISIDKRFYIYAIKSLLSTINNRRHGSTMTHITKKDFESLYFPLPPLEEQHRIVAKIEELLPYVDRYAESYEKLEQFNAKFPEDMKKSILQYAIQGKLVEQRSEEGTAEELYQQIQEEKQELIKEGKIRKEKPLAEITEDEIPFDIPESWKWVRLGQCVSILGDGIHGTPNYTPNEEYHFVNGNNLSDGSIVIKTDTKTVAFEEYEKYKKELNDHTVFVSINGTIGNVAFYNNERIILGKSACYFNLIDKEWKEFIYWIIKTDYFLKYAMTNATGSTIKNVSLATMKMFPVPLPPLEEQHRIVAKIEELLPFCEQLTK